MSSSLITVKVFVLAIEIVSANPDHAQSAMATVAVSVHNTASQCTKAESAIKLIENRLKSIKFRTTCEPVDIEKEVPTKSVL